MYDLKQKNDNDKPYAYKKIATIFFMMILLLVPKEEAVYMSGRVIDSVTGRPVKDATVTVNQSVVQTDEKGSFIVHAMGQKIMARACGCLRTEQSVAAPLVAAPLQINLIPFKPKALYLSFYGIGSRTLREAALRLIDETELNALVIDVKGDRGLIVYKSSIPLAKEVNAQRHIIIRDMVELMQSLKKRGIYTIARIVVFKDNPLAHARPDLAVKTAGGAVWLDNENLAWVDPAKKEVWDYNIGIAEEAARSGFDEIQFDYVRFPDAAGLAYSVPNNQGNRVRAITGFLVEARKKLKPYNVFLAADIFGYVCWNLDDTKIGQRLEDIAPLVDYISPMLYPSGFQFGIPGYRIPVAHPFEIVYRTLRRSQERTGLDPVRFRPWLQAFRDYAFDRRYFGRQQIQAQISAADQFGSDGWMLWNPQNIYSTADLKK